MNYIKRLQADKAEAIDTARTQNLIKPKS